MQRLSFPSPWILRRLSMLALVPARLRDMAAIGWRWWIAVPTADPVTATLHQGVLGILLGCLIVGSLALVIDQALGFGLLDATGWIIGLSSFASTALLARRGLRSGVWLVVGSTTLLLPLLIPPASYAGVHPLVPVVFAYPILLATLFLSPRAGWLTWGLQLIVLLATLVTAAFPPWQIARLLEAAALDLGLVASVAGVAALVFTRSIRAAIDANHALQELTASLETQVAARTTELAAARQQTENFLRRIVHDQAAPLQGARSAALVAPVDPAAQQQLLQQLDHLNQLALQLSTYLHAQHTPLCSTTIDLAPVCAAAIGATYEQTQMSGARLRLIVSVPATCVIGDATAIRRVLDNLLANALAVTPAEGDIVITINVASTCPAMLRLAVTDSGPGIAPEHHHRIFDPLVRLQASGSGLGLGLAIVCELVAAMKGTYGVDSVLGMGSTFWVCLPIAGDA